MSMSMPRHSLLLVAVVLAAACGGSEAPPAAPAKSAATSPTAAPVAGGRTISDSAKAAMKEALGVEQTKKRAWLYSQPGNPEVAALVTSIQDVFRDSGWEVTGETASGISLKPGVMTLIAEEQYPPYVEAVVKALEASGLDAKSASGYRAYYAEKRKENPNWPGIPLKDDQDFVIVIGPKPAG